jgi:hypothetical protein
MYGGKVVCVLRNLPKVTAIRNEKPSPQVCLHHFVATCFGFNGSNILTGCT